MTKGRIFFKRGSLGDTQREQAIAAEIGVPFAISRPLSEAGPLLVATPHSGRIYPKSWLSTLKIPATHVRQAEDALVDDLVAGAPLHGITHLRARFPRSLVDVNRARTDLAPEMGGTGEGDKRVKAGLGVIPRAISQSLWLYDSPPSPEAAQARLKAFYDPYHEALSELMRAAKAQHGHAVLLDMHSMPALPAQFGTQPDFVLGDLFGRSCSPGLSEAVAQYLRGLGYHVAYNHPYAGGYITQNYGQPDQAQHVLQIEINRGLYLSPGHISPSKGFDRLAAHLDGLMAHIHTRLKAGELLNPPRALAAE